MAVSEKVDFFVRCQQLLVQFHADSEFICRKDNMTQRLKQIKAWVDKYKGICYQHDNVCVLYNRIVVSDPLNPAQAVASSMYQPPNDNYNAIIIDFAAFRDIKDCVTFVKDNYDPRVQHVLFVRHGKVKIYAVVDLVAQIFNMPVV